jgi:hypothetical protein
MKTLFALFAFALSAAACAHGSESTAPPAKPVPPGDRIEPADVEPARNAGFEGLVRIQAGAWPRSNSHLFGSRSFDLRRDGNETQVRIHDRISFQGAGMRPEHMAPPQHKCTAWEPVSDVIARRIAEIAPSRNGDEPLACEDHRETCSMLHGHFRSTAKPVESTDNPALITQVEDLQANYGRATGSCS